MVATLIAAIAGPIINIAAKYALAWLASYEAKARRHKAAAASLHAAQIIAAKTSRKDAVDALDEGGV
jgi:hypothetical protein